MAFIVKTEFDVDDDDAKAIAEILKTNKTLTSIDVYHKDITVDGAKAIAEALKTNKTLTDLRLTRKSFTHIYLICIFTFVLQCLFVHVLFSNR